MKKKRKTTYLTKIMATHGTNESRFNIFVKTLIHASYKTSSNKSNEFPFE